LLDPFGIDTGLAGVNVTVPVESLASVTVRVASVVFGLLNASCRCTVIELDATPAVTVTAVVVHTSLLAAPTVTVSVCVAEVIVVGYVLAAVIVGVPAFAYTSLFLSLLDPFGIDTGLAGANVTVPVELLASVTVRVASNVFGFPDASCRCT